MIRNGDRLENPVTGEVLIFRRTARDTGGEYVLVETIVRPDGFVAAAHVHPHQSERFEVLEGRLGMRAGDRQVLAGPGDVVTVAPGTPHRFWNAGKTEVRFLAEVRPALDFESLIETMFSLAAAGKTNRKGHAQPAPSRRDRAIALRHRAAAVPADLAAAGGARAGRAGRPPRGVPADGQRGRRLIAASGVGKRATAARGGGALPTWP